MAQVKAHKLVTYGTIDGIEAYNRTMRYIIAHVKYCARPYKLPVRQLYKEIVSSDNKV